MAMSHLTLSCVYRWASGERRRALCHEGLSNNLKPPGSITQIIHAYTCVHAHTPHTKPLRQHVCHRREVWQRLGWPDLADGSSLPGCSRCGLLKASSRNRASPDGGPFLISVWGWLPQGSPQPAPHPAHSLRSNNLNLPRWTPYTGICQTLGKRAVDILQSV